MRIFKGSTAVTSKRKSIAILTLSTILLLSAALSLSPYSINNRRQIIENTVQSILKGVQAGNSNIKENKTIESGVGEYSGLSKNYVAVVPNDSLYSQQWGLSHTDSAKAWQQVKQKRQIKVAVVDTGVDYNHPDLKNRVLVELGYDFYNDDKDPMDDSWHGTHIAGIIAAETNNGIGVAGMAGELDVVIIPIKVLGKDGRGPSPVIAEGIRYAVDKGADIINFSVTFKAKDKFIEEAVKYAKDNGVFVVTASGNDGSNCDSFSPQVEPGAFTVAALNSQREKAYFSNFGRTVEVSAPGSGILSTVPGGGYEYRDGTSMAAPMVSGLAAILKAENPQLSPEELRAIITKSSVKTATKVDEPIGSGFINAYDALKMLRD